MNNDLVFKKCKDFAIKFKRGGQYLFTEYSVIAIGFDILNIAFRHVHQLQGLYVSPSTCIVMAIVSYLLWILSLLFPFNGLSKGLFKLGTFMCLNLALLPLIYYCYDQISTLIDVNLLN